MFDIETILDSLGVEGMRVGSKEITALCPMHEQRIGRPDRHASWSINRRTGLHICFSCGWSGGITTLYLDLGHPMPEDLETEMLRSAIQSSMAKASGTDFVPAVAPEPPPLPDDDLVPVPPSMLSYRKLTAQACDDYGVRWSRSRRAWVTPLYHPRTGDLLGYQFRQKGNELNEPEGLEKSTTLFGFHAMAGHKGVALVESPLDAVRLWSVGAPAVASFGAWVSKEQLTLLSNNWNWVLLALDNDAAGQSSTETVAKLLVRRGCPVFFFRYGNSGVKDPGDFETNTELEAAWRRSLP